MAEKKFYIENLGCAKNQVDAETMISSMTGDGWVFTQADDADLIIINTCGFIKPAKEESIQTVLTFRQQYPGKRIVLAGCLAQRYGEELSSSFPEADAVFGNRFPEKITDAADSFLDGTRNLYFPEKEGSSLFNKTSEIEKKYRDGQSGFPPHEGKKAGKRVSLSFPGSVYVKIAEGCSNNCSYCAIPLIRGPLSSRNEDDIIREISELAEAGFFEINLIAQDLASYGLDTGSSLMRLLERITRIEGKFWIRLLYMHPDRFDREITGLMKSDSRILPYFDIPFQHASQGILSAMGRKGSHDAYLRLVSDIRSDLPDAVIRSTFLLGFPGEGSEDFLLVKSFLENACLDWAGFFQYSREEGTRAYKAGNAAANYVLAKKTPGRIALLQDIQTEITGNNLERFTGRTLEVLAEETIPEEGIVLGRGYLNAPDVDGAVIIHSESVKPGEVARCRITRRNNIDLEAVPL